MTCTNARTAASHELGYGRLAEVIDAAHRSNIVGNPKTLQRVGVRSLFLTPLITGRHYSQKMRSTTLRA